MPHRFVLALGALASVSAAIWVTVLSRDVEAQTVGQAQLVSAYRWYGNDDAFGGFSGIDVSDDGSTFVAITDRSHVTRGKITREDGVITKVAHSKLEKLTSPRGAPLVGIWADSEGLAVAQDGTVTVSFEIAHRTVQYTPGNKRGKDLPANPATDKMVANSAQEALAVAADGTLYMIPEGDGAEKTPHKVYRLRPGASNWDQPYTIPRYRPYVPVGADIGPDGRLYVLERHLSSIFGFTSRVRRFDMEPNALINETILLESEVGLHDNLEGLAVWRDEVGLIRLTMVSDDNFKFFQVTEIVEYVVPDVETKN
ncbi:esterase-like activity of phytase family protein [Aliiroseovarius sp. 2305UL8-7]|uniref:esterase-like activity of phytase family protein n=1 Tax=Aliiroseovarius conchicola TaxID=3121637 RepID=UPI003529C7AC